MSVDSFENAPNVAAALGEEQQLLMHHLDLIDEAHDLMFATAELLRDRPIPYYEKKLTRAADSWLLSVEECVVLLEKDANPDAPIIMAHRFIEEDTARVTAFRNILPGTDFDYCDTSADELNILFSADDESEVIDHVAVMGYFKEALLEDLVTFGKNVSPNRLSKIVDLAPTLGKTLLDVAKITAGVWAAQKLGRKRI